jgi:predicted DNA binding CopG/RHH family protein
MYIAEQAAQKWLMRRYNLKLEQVIKCSGTPDFKTPVGGFEVKSLINSRVIYFMPSQPRTFEADPTIKVLVFDKECFIDVIPGEIIKNRASEYKNIRIQYTSGTSSKTTRVSFRLLNEDIETLKRRAGKWCGGNLSEYIEHIVARELNRDHHKRKGK